MYCAFTAWSQVQWVAQSTFDLQDTGMSYELSESHLYLLQ